MRISCWYDWDNPTSAQLGKCSSVLTSKYFNFFCPIYNTSFFPEAVSCPGLVSTASLLPAPAHFPTKRCLGNNQDFQNYLNLRSPVSLKHIFWRVWFLWDFFNILCFYLNDITKHLHICSEIFENDFIKGEWYMTSVSPFVLLSPSCLCQRKAIGCHGVL